MARLALVTVLALILFVWLAREVTRGDAMRLDTPIREAVHARSSPPLTAMMRGVSLIGSEVVLVPLGVILVWRLVAAKRRRAAVVFGVAALGAEALDQIMKLLFDRPRPEPFFGLASPITHSFPSGHAMVSCCFFGVLAMILAARGAVARQENLDLRRRGHPRSSDGIFARVPRLPLSDRCLGGLRRGGRLAGCGARGPYGV